MAENDQRSYREMPRWRGAQEGPRAQADDPLAELARLIGQGAPANKVGRDRTPVTPESADDRRGETAQGGGYPAPDEVFPNPASDRYSASEDQRYQRDVELDHSARGDERYERATDASPAPPARASRFRQEPDYAVEPARVADREAAYDETAEWHDGSDEGRSHYPDNYEDEPHDADDRAYDHEYSEDRSTGRRGGFVLVAAVFALAVLGTAGAFAYRAMFGASALPALPPIIKAEGGPNKIIPSGAGAPDSTAREADASDATSRERLVSREEQPVDVSPPAPSAVPRPVSTVPVFPDPPPLGGPGAVLGYSASPSNNPATSTQAPVPAAPAMTAESASNPAPSVTQSPAPLPTPAPVPGATSTVAMPVAPGPKRIRTVTIRADQSGAPDAGVQTRPAAQSPQGSNAPLSIVPSAIESSAAPARPRPAPVQPAPLNKPPANATASAAPAASVPAAGGYAVQVSSQRSEEEVQSSFRDLQAKYPDLLGGRTPIIRRADLGAKGIFFRALVGPFASADQATELCSNLKAAGGSCLVQKN